MGEKMDKFAKVTEAIAMFPIKAGKAVNDTVNKAIDKTVNFFKGLF